jgi:hypothetical protein
MRLMCNFLNFLSKRFEDFQGLTALEVFLFIAAPQLI